MIGELFFFVLNLVFVGLGLYNLAHGQSVTAWAIILPLNLFTAILNGSAFERQVTERTHKRGKELESN